VNRTRGMIRRPRRMGHLRRRFIGGAEAVIGGPVGDAQL
jgi:hypothetical protein